MPRALRQKRKGGKALKEGAVARAEASRREHRTGKASEVLVKARDFILRALVII